MHKSRVLLLAFTFTASLSMAALAENDQNSGKHDTAKGAAAGALVGHEVGSGHAVAGAAAGAAIGHHEKNKARDEEKNGK